MPRVCPDGAGGWAVTPETPPLVAKLVDANDEGIPVPHSEHSKRENAAKEALKELATLKTIALAHISHEDMNRMVGNYFDKVIPKIRDLLLPA